MRWSQLEAESLPIYVAIGIVIVASMLAGIVGGVFKHKAAAVIIGGIVGGLAGFWGLRLWGVDASSHVLWPGLCAVFGATSAAGEPDSAKRGKTAQPTSGTIDNCK